MPVPNTTTFNLQNVVDEITGTQTSLSACFTDAASSGFNPLYEGSKNNLLNFRDYAHPTGVPTTSISLGVGASSTSACSNFPTPVTRYIAPQGSDFISATAIYTNSTGTILAAASWFSDGSVVREWNGSSFVGSSQLCI